MSIGHDPVGLGVAVVNHEKSVYDEPCISTSGCNLSMLSCRYLDHLQTRKVEYTNFETIGEAQQFVRKGHAWAAIEFSDNYTESLMKRVEDGKDADSYALDASDLNIWVDMSSEYYTLFLQIETKTNGRNGYRR